MLFSNHYWWCVSTILSRNHVNFSWKSNSGISRKGNCRKRKGPCSWLQRVGWNDDTGTTFQADWSSCQWWCFRILLRIPTGIPLNRVVFSSSGSLVFKQGTILIFPTWVQGEPSLWSRVLCPWWHFNSLGLMWNPIIFFILFQ